MERGLDGGILHACGVMPTDVKCGRGKTCVFSEKVRVCVCARARPYVRACMCAFMDVCMHACVCVCVHACVRAHVSAYVGVGACMRGCLKIGWLA